MLDRTQEILLQLVKEIDTLCQANDIHYSLGGGTTIGAIRHKGFIPWDDDVDLYMTRENWVKFMKVYEDGKFPQNRVLESCEFDAEYSNTFGRYVATDNSAVHPNQIAYDDPAGYVIDIFVFDPIMKKDMNRFLEIYMLECDLINMTMGYSTRFDMNINRYKQYLARKNREGIVSVTRELTSEIVSLGNGGHDSYAMEWGSGPMLMDATIFDQGYIRIPYENIEVESVRAYSEYLTYQYGDEWVYIPWHEGVEGHEAIYSEKIPYDVIREDLRSSLDLKKLKKAYISRKIKLLKSNPLRHKIQDFEAAFEGIRVKLELERIISENSIDIDKLYADGDFAELDKVFSSYFRMQLSPEFIGRVDRHSKQYRYFNPVSIMLEDRLMKIALETLIRTERMSKAARLLDVYSHCGGSNADVLLLKQEITLARKLINEYSMSTSEEQVKMIPRVEEFIEKYPRNSQIKRLRIRLAIEDAALGSKADNIGIIGRILDELDKVFKPGTLPYGELHKYRGDVAYLLEGDASRAKEHYEYAYNHSTNGIIRSEIESVAEDLGLKLVYSDQPWTELGNKEEYLAHVKSDEVWSAASGMGLRKSKLTMLKIRRKLYSALVKKDDTIKQDAIDIFKRTEDRVSLLEHYEDKLDELLRLRNENRFEELAQLMKPHREALERNYKAGLGLMVHPVLSDIEYELLRQEGKQEMAEKIDRLIPLQHRKPIGE